MRDPYQQRRDFSRVGIVVVAVLALLLAALLAFYVLRPGPSAEDRKASAQFASEMDRSQARADAQDREKAADQARLLQ